MTRAPRTASSACHKLMDAAGVCYDSTSSGHCIEMRFNKVFGMLLSRWSSLAYAQRIFNEEKHPPPSRINPT